jgi:N-acetylneuraminic acid mutarotase
MPGGGSSGTKYFTVTNSQTEHEWTWMSGSNQVNAVGSYGSLGVASSANVPGARGYASSWADNSGNLRLFGGGNVSLNDLWEFNPSSGFWTWMSGSNTGNGTGVYGVQGVPSTTNVPHARDSAMSWIDSNGNLWLFGGSNSLGTVANDLWEFIPATKTWTWISGSSSTQSQPGVYGTIGVPSTANVPGSRGAGVSWIDSSGNLWLFGGTVSDSVGSGGLLNDMWEFSPTNKTWTWVSGSGTLQLFADGFRGQPSVYGTQGTPGAANVPCGRYFANSWVDANGNFWLFGGYGQPSPTSGVGALNDLWEFNPTSNQWTWVSGGSSLAQPGVYGTLGAGSTANVPGARQMAFSWTDASGNLWLFGGIGYDSTGYYQYLNDLWEFSPTSKTWTWMSGSNRTNGAGTWGTLGAPATANVPGSRDQGVTWVDNSGNLWLFGGYGSDSVGNGGYLNDLWRYQP